jgi:hypothetical protein
MNTTEHDGSASLRHNLGGEQVHWGRLQAAGLFGRFERLSH